MTPELTLGGSSILEKALGNPQHGLGPDWEGRAAALRDFVNLDPDPTHLVLDAADIESFLTTTWLLPILKFGRLGSDADTPFHGRQSGEDVRGKFFVRRLSLNHTGDGYIVVNEKHYDRYSLWTLLHELGHVALHCESYRDLGDTYRQIAKDPLGESAAFTEFSSRWRSAEVENEADDFAASWILGKALQSAHPQLDSYGLCYAFQLQCFGAESIRSDYSWPEAADLNEAGRDAFERFLVGATSIPTIARRAGRAFWRHLARMKNLPVPVADSDVLLRADGGSDITWLSRIPASEAVRYLDERSHWRPFLVRDSETTVPHFYVPIAPVSRNGPGADSDRIWRNMLKPEYRAGKALQSWLKVGQEWGLMVFPRTPAERFADSAR